MITFTHDNAQTPQVLTIKGVDDEIADGDQPYTVLSSATASSDPRFQGIDVPDLQVINSDDDMPGLLVTPSSGLMTSETGGQASFSVKLTTQPLRDCLLSLSSSNTNEGVLSVTQLLFTPTSWNTPQTVIVRGVDDAMADGAQDYRVRISRISSQDPRYDGMLAPDVSVINSDDDRASVIVEPISGLTTSEDGASTTFTIRLGTMPEAQVTFNLSSDKPSEGFPTTYSVSFTQDNWFRAQSITIKGVDDIISDGAQTYNIVIEPAQTVDSIYRGIDPPDVSVTNTDNDPKYYFWPNNIMPRYYPY